ncbi:hypothetical protein ONZ45_g6334 [Pleurotus djamor]|nr:hypothetical protein ONZ45_g6334 [Pleurotus djamor]
MKGPQLPHELLRDIVDYIDLNDRSSLLNLLVSCRTLRAIAEPHFYHDVVFTIEASRDRSHLGQRIKRFYELISKDCTRLSPFVRQITFATGPPELMFEEVAIISEILPLLINLETFHFSNFDLNTPCAPLLKSSCSPNLRTIIWNCSFLNQAYYLNEFLELHPSIQRLELLHKHHPVSLSFPSLPHLRELVATPEVAWALLPDRHVTHLQLHSTLSQSMLLHGPIGNQCLSKLTHFQMSRQGYMMRYLTLIRHMSNLRCLICPLTYISTSITQLPQLFITGELGSRLSRLEYFSLNTGRRMDFSLSVQTVLDLFKSLPSLRVFDLQIDYSNFTRYRHDGQSAVMPLPMFQGTWPSDHELARILQTPVKTVLE